VCRVEAGLILGWTIIHAAYESLRELGDNLEQIAHHAVVGNLEDRRVLSL